MREILFFLLCTFSFKITFSQTAEKNTNKIRNNKLHKRGNDHIDLAMEFDASITKDPVTGKVPRYVLAEANRQAKQSQEERKRQMITYRMSNTLIWTERGSDSDTVGPGNGNTRPGGAVTSGRIRAIWPDLTDTSGNTVWVGGVAGGLWKTNNINQSPAHWNVINDYLSNLAVTGICQDPVNTNVMYFCTGEAFFNSDAVSGNGVYKSMDGGNNWFQLSNTASYNACSKILCDANGNVFLATVGNGMKRSLNGGETWSDITPTGLTNHITDFEISSSGRMHISCGLHSVSNGFRFTDVPSNVTSSTWKSPHVPFRFPQGVNSRVEIGCSGNVLYAALSNSKAVVDSISKSIDGGVTWTTSALSPSARQALNGEGASSQAWYCLTVGIHPANANLVMIGNLNVIKSFNGGISWIKGSEWAGTTGQYVHADQHAIVWYKNGSRLLFGSDGGIHYSSDSGVNIRDRNTHLRLKQFYSVAVHPQLTNYFLAGSQDNGVHQMNTPGIASSVEITGGDGGYVAIDQMQPTNQFCTYVYNAYRRSINNGNNWSTIDFYKDTPNAPSNFGLFINPYAYDSQSKIIYASAGGGEIFRWLNPSATPPGTYYQSSGWPAGVTLITQVVNLASQKISAIHVSPSIANRLYFGTENGKLIYLDSANTATHNVSGRDITGAGFSGTISSINTGTDEEHLVVSFSNYNTNNVWVSINRGLSWTAVDGNLPNMPVRWAMFYPGINNKLIIATEAGVWETEYINGNNTVWTANPTFPVVRTNMLQYRNSDRLIAAATHGRGLFTAHLPICETPVISVTPSDTNYCTGNNSILLSASGGMHYSWSPSTGLSSSTGSSVWVNPSSSTTYVVNGFDANGCVGVATVNVHVAPGISISASASPANICSGSTTALTAHATFIRSQNCIPPYTYGTAGGDYISHVNISGTSLNNISGASPFPFYTLFTPSFNTTASLEAGNNYYLMVKGVSSSSTYIRAWIDYDQDGTFSASETIGVSSNAASTTATISFIIPNSAYNGSTRIRLRSSNIFPGPAANDACGNTKSGFGETEEYEINIVNGTNPFTYSWSPALHVSSASAPSTFAYSISENDRFTVTVNSAVCSTTADVNLQIINVPAPTAIHNARCGQGTLVISASTDSMNTIDWYSSPSGGTPLLIGTNQFTTSGIAATTIYYAEARNIISNCISSNRTPVIATVHPVPPTPSISSSGSANICNGGSLTLISDSPGNNLWSTGSDQQSIIVNRSGNYTVTVHNAAGCLATSTPFTVSVQTCFVFLHLKLFLEGFYGGNSNMNTNLYDIAISEMETAVDSIIVSLWLPQSLNNPIPAFLRKAILHKNGTISVSLPGRVSGNSYYISIRHRNHLETWSAEPIVFTPVTSYDFSTGNNKAYHDGVNRPMKRMEDNVYALYAGDINNDGSVDAIDISMAENGASQYEYGYFKNDVNGDSATDGTDIMLIEDNAQLFLYYARPY